MTYEQSLKQCEELRNFVMPYNCEMIIFDFSSVIEFKLIFLEKVDWDFQGKLADLRFEQHLSFAMFYDNQFIYYNNVGDFHFSQWTGELIDFRSITGYKQVCSTILKIEMASLVRQLRVGVSDSGEDGVSN